MRSPIFFLPLLVSMTALAQVPNLDSRLAAIEAKYERCLKAAEETGATMDCHLDKHEASDALLNEVYQARVADLKETIEREKNLSADQQYGAEELRRLVKAQRAWIAFRDADCELWGASMMWGTGESKRIAWCLADKTWQRVKEIAY